MMKQQYICDTCKTVNHFESMNWQCSHCASPIVEYISDLEQRVSELEAAQQWRSMDSAPDNDNILLLFESGIQFIGRYFKNINNNLADDERMTQPIAWKPAPQPPKDE